MGIRRLYLVVLMLLIVCQQAGSAQNKPPAQGNGTPAKQELNAELSVFKEALLKTGSLQAASVMLDHKDPNARRILLDVLNQSDNSPARMAVCRALIKAKADKKAVKDVKVFIGPLLDVFDTQVAAEAQLAADATMIFGYEQIGEPLEKFVTDASKPAGARANAVNALKLRRDNKRAAIKLIELLDDQDKHVSSEAKIALDSLGIVPGDTKEARQETIKQIEDQAPAVFLASRISNLEQQKRAMKAELDSWVDSYLGLLSSTYKSLTEDDAKRKFLAEYLASSRAPVKLWALEEALRWWKGTARTFPSEQFEPILIASISDPHKDVRLRTAEVLAEVVMVNSARPLLDQLELEQDDQVKTKLFIALGRACSSTTSPGTEDELSPEIKAIRTQALTWAEKFLFDKNDSDERIQIGAQVTERLLKRDGLEDAEEMKYLDLLLNRYKQLKSNPGGTLAGELLGAMAGLCTQSSACRDQAIKRYKPLFTEALRDASDSVRETAVDGLYNINKADALAILRKSHVNDSSLAIRKKIIKMAGEVLVEPDLDWLVDKIGVNSESEPAWQAMTGIFNRSGADTLSGWVDRLTASTSKVKLTDEQKIAFLKTAESKAEGEKKAQMLGQVRKRLAATYRGMSQFDKAAECWQKLEAAAKTRQEKDSAMVQRLDIYLNWPKPDLAAKLLAEALAARDLEREGALLKSLEEHLVKPQNGLDPNVVIAQLTAIKPPKERPKWDQWLKDWQTRLSKEDKPAAKPKPPAG